MDIKYFCVDIESTGRTPGNYTMLSFGATVVGDTQQQFYRELQPINYNYVFERTRIGSLGLECLKERKSDPRYNPESSKFDPLRVLRLMKKNCADPQQSMLEFREWVLGLSQGYEPRICAAPIKFDGAWISWYFDHFFDEMDPFAHHGEDINSLYRGHMNDVLANIKQLGLRSEKGLNHNALEDAIQEALEMEAVLNLMKKERRS
jgi:hypothetical protein